jgi:hypothetical protein
MYLDIERAVIAALGATVYARRLRSIFKFFSARCASAMDAYMDMDKGIAGCTRGNGHVSLSLLCVIGRVLPKPFFAIEKPASLSAGATGGPAAHTLSPT